jgi:hypothetical protein
MRRLYFLLLFLVIAMTVKAQFVYKGAVDKYEVEFFFDVYSDNDVTAVYAYGRFDKPIRISGRQSDSGLMLIERAFEIADTTTMWFPGDMIGADSLRGTWFNVRTGRRFEIRLAKQINLEEKGDQSYKNVAILQDAEMDSAYFRILVSRTPGNGPAVTGVRILRKGDDRLIQELVAEGSYIGLGSIRTGDYNFDGIEDFSLFGESYAGPNTSSDYYLYDPRGRKFFLSGIKGVSLEFDPKRKRITEVNQCCAGSQVLQIEYKLVNNKMIQTGMRCFKWDHKLDRLVERPAKECQ